jgi:hypothetical protein
MVGENNGVYIVQHPKVMLEISLGYDADTKAVELARKRFFPSLGTSDMLRWMRRYSKVYVSVSQWFTDIRRYDLHVGTRIHGSQAAIQAGIPSVCLYKDSRTKELCIHMHIPHASALEYVDKLSPENLIELCRTWDWQEYDRRRVAAADQTNSFLIGNQVTPSKHLARLLQG